jgi:uncharacterized protein
MALRHTAKGILLSVRATPKAAANKIGGLRDGAVVVKVTAAPDKGKANAAVVALLAKTIGIPKSALDLVAGETDRNKLFRLASHEGEVQTWLEGLQKEERHAFLDCCCLDAVGSTSPGRI